MKLERVNDILVVAIVVINLFVLCMPFVPAAWFWVKQAATKTTQQLDQQIQSSNDIPQDNRLVIPKIMLNEPYFEGVSAATLNKGLWHQPSSNPGEPGSTVIAGHRFTYDDPEGAFYHLDKLEKDDKIAIYWDGQKYLYSVNDKQVVGAGYQLSQGGSNRLILYTCTPIWNPKDRLIITAEPINTQGAL